MEKLLNNLITYWTSQRISFVLIIIILTILLILSINLILGKNILKPSVQDKIVRINNINKVKLFIYNSWRNFINKVILFRNKHGLYFLNAYTEEDKNNILERNNKKLTPINPTFMTWKEYSSCNLVFSIIITLIFIVCFILIKQKFIIIIVYLLILLFINYIRFAILEYNVNQQNNIISASFDHFYMSQYHILLAGLKNPLTNGLMVYQYKTTNPFMLQWTKQTLQSIQQTSEQEVITRYKRLYKDILVLQRLLNIEENIILGGDATTELKNIRNQIIDNRKMTIELNARKIEQKVSIIRIIVFIIVIQFCIAAVVYVFLYSGGINF